MRYTAISSDDHLDIQYIPLDLWEQRVASQYREDAPRIIRDSGVRKWVCQGQDWGYAGRPPGISIKRAYDWAGISDEPEPDVFRASSPTYRCEDMDRDGIAAQIIYGPIAPLGRISDPELQAVCCAAYNSWLKEVKDESGERMLGLAILPLSDRDAATKELRRVAKLGLKGISFDGFSAPKPIWDEVWEPLWAAAAETGLPVSVHVGAGVRTAQAGNPHRGQSLIFAAALPVQLDEIFAGIIFSGILDRHPKIRFVLAETGIGWIAYYLHRMDRECRGPFPTDITLSAPPSELFRRQMYVTFQEEEEEGLRRIPEIGVDNVMWASDYPHPDSTWPHSQEQISQLDFFGEEVKRKLTFDNVVKLYGLG